MRDLECCLDYTQAIIYNLYHAAQCVGTPSDNQSFTDALNILQSNEVKQMIELVDNFTLFMLSSPKLSMSSTVTSSSNEDSFFFESIKNHRTQTYRKAKNFLMDNLHSFQKICFLSITVPKGTVHILVTP